MTIGECIIEMPANKIEARNLRRQLLIWRERDAEHRKRFERLERQYIKRFGREGLPLPDMPLSLRVEVLEYELDLRLR